MRTRGPILMLLCVLASLLVPGIASATTVSGALTRVWAFDFAKQVHVGGSVALTLELCPGCEPTYDQLVSDSLLAARGGAQLSKQAQKGIRSLEKRIAEHEKKLADFRANPTPRPGTEGLSKEIQQQSIDGRIRHLEKEIETFRNNIEKLRGGGQ